MKKGIIIGAIICILSAAAGVVAMKCLKKGKAV